MRANTPQASIAVWVRSAWAAAEADNRRVLSAALEQLLSQHQEICMRIIDFLDSGQSDD
jgi:hypothetical protein